MGQEMSATLLSVLNKGRKVSLIKVGRTDEKERNQQLETRSRWVQEPFGPSSAE